MSETDIETGVETNNSRIRTTEYDAEAYADDGEHATSWMLKRIDETTVEIEYIRCEAGLRDSDTTEVFEVDEDKSTVEFAREVANADPQVAVEAARNWHNGDRV
jgi:SOS response regulatory protein OraA/RecX